MITQCPGCKTRFRLPLDQVATSRGEVFCGECHSQFNALDYLVIEEGVTPGKPTLTDRAQKGDDNAQGNTLFLPINENTIANLLSEGSTSETGAEESAAPEQYQPSEGESPQLTPITQSSSPTLTDPLIQQALQPQAGKESNRPEESIASSAPTHRKSKKYQLKQKAKSPDTEHQHTLWSTTISSLAIVLLVTTLGLQYLLIQREHFSQNKYFRTLLTIICPQVGCDIPLQRDLSLLAITDNSIETHPQHPETLLITANLANRGRFKQNYPIVELVMTNIQQEEVVKRSFYPDEYLPDFANSEPDYFAANSQQQLLLEIVDPGSHATGFEFFLHSRNY